MLTVKVQVRNMESMAQGLPQLAEVLVGNEVLPPGELREYTFTEEDDLKLKVRLTKEGEELKKEIKKGDEEAAGANEKAARERGEKKETRVGKAPESPNPSFPQGGPAQRQSAR